MVARGGGRIFRHGSQHSRAAVAMARLSVVKNTFGGGVEDKASQVLAIEAFEMAQRSLQGTARHSEQVCSLSFCIVCLERDCFK